MGHRVTAIVAAATPWREVVLVCRKCSRKLDGGFGRKGAETLRAVLRVALREAGKRREVRVVEVGCLGLCPRRAVTVLRACQPGEMLAVPEGTAPEVVIGRIGLI